MKGKDGLRWFFMAVIAIFLFYLGKANYHQRNPAEFVLIILGAMAALILAFCFLGNRQRS